MTYDPVLLEVQWSRLLTVVEEQAAAMIRTSFSPLIRDNGDLSAGVFDHRGYMLAQANTGTPGHINPMSACMKHMLREYPLETLEPGDILITNDPWLSAGQLNDFTVVTPVFRGGRVVAFFGSACHAIDIGGRTLSADARSVFEEGLQVPITKFYFRGEPNRELMRSITANVREPEVVLGDLHAQVAAGDVGARRLLEFMDEFEMDDLVTLGDEIMHRSEQAVRQALRRMPDGVYRQEIWSDGYDQPVKLCLTLTKEGDSVTCDFAGSSPESSYGINVVLNYTHAYCTYGLKCLFSPEVPNNEGSFRPIRVEAPEGCILNARRPAPVAWRHILGHMVPLLIFGALQDVMPTMAEGSGNLWAMQSDGYWEDGRNFTSFLLTCGGTGARPDRDGLSSTAFPSGINGTPVEVIETISPLIVERKEFRMDSGGPGEWRGGLGHELVLRNRTLRPWALSVSIDRTRYAARGYKSGGDGGLGEMIYGDDQRALTKARLHLGPYEQSVLRLPGGGGYGDPLERESWRVARDVKLGLVGSVRARTAYGVVLDDAGQVDEIATRRLRAELVTARTEEVMTSCRV